MQTIGSFEAKNKLSALLDIVEDGGEVVITRRGKPVAKLVQPHIRTTFDRETALKAVAELRELSKGCILGDDLTLKDLINDGRKWI